MDKQEPFPFLNDDYRLWVLLSQTRSALFKARHKRVKRYIHFNVAASLLHIWRHDGEVNMTDLARQLFLEPHSASEIVNRLEKKGFVEKSKTRGKGNIVNLWITDKGRNFCRESTQPGFIHEMISSLTREQQEQLRTCLYILYDKALEDMGLERLDEETQ
jgi:DNA-binding MarR family transcriptional regulator